MAFSTDKRKKPPGDDEKSIIGYVQNLSPIKKSRRPNSTFKYASFTLQTSQTDSLEVLIYSEQKRSLFEESQETRIPIKIKDYAFTDDKEKLVVNDITHISTPKQCEYEFQYTEVKCKPPALTTIIEVLNDTKEWANVTIKGKITRSSETRVVGKNKLKLAEAVIADETAYIPIDIWEEHIPLIAQDKVYTLKSVQLRIWAGKKKLSTTKKTTIELVNEDLNITSDALDEQDDKDDIATVTATKFRRMPRYEMFNRCNWCQRRIPQATTSNVVKCNNCGIIKKEDIAIGITSTVVVQVETGELLTLKIRDEMLEKILEHDVKEMDEEQLSNELLYKENITLTYDVHNLLVKEIL